MPTTFKPSGRFMSCWVVFRVIAAVCAAYYVLGHTAFGFDPELSFVIVITLDVIAWVDM